MATDQEDNEEQLAISVYDGLSECLGRKGCSRTL